MTTTLYRAAVENSPYFGHGSYWSASADFARCFAEWVNAEPRLAHLGQHVIYRADVELTGVHSFDAPMPSKIMSGVTHLLAVDGDQWISFIERGPTDGLSSEFAALTRTCPQYIYLGDEPIHAEAVQP